MAAAWTTGRVWAAGAAGAAGLDGAAGAGWAVVGAAGVARPRAASKKARCAAVRAAPPAELAPGWPVGGVREGRMGVTTGRRFGQHG